jgi:putative holliday junction resolvase
MRTLGIDLGTKRVGLALSDEGGRFATPLEVIEVRSPGQLLEEITFVINGEGVKRLVIGLPLNMDGSLGPAAKKTIEWAKQFESLTVLFVDERLSSFEAEQQLIERKRAGEKLTRQRKKEQLDAFAAAGFLQSFLDGKLQAIDLESIDEQSV